MESKHTKFKGTKLPWNVRSGNGLLFVESSKENLGTPYGQEIMADDYFDEDWKLHDANLISDASHALHNSGLLPSELMERYNEAIEELEKIKNILSKEWPKEEWIEFDDEVGYSKVLNKALKQPNIK